MGATFGTVPTWLNAGSIPLNAQYIDLAHYRFPWHWTTFNWVIMPTLYYKTKQTILVIETNSSFIGT